MKVFIFWASHAYWPAAALLIVLIWKRTGPLRWFAILMLIAISTLAYARFVEPRILNVERTEIALSGATGEHDTTIRIALFADTHLGIFRNAVPMRRIVARLKEESPDAVFIAGDFLYHLSPDEIPTALATLSELPMPVYAVLGNHDVGFPGPIYDEELYEALAQLGVIMVENRAINVNLNNQDIVIAGASDLWQQQQDFSFSRDIADRPILLLTHNPDTALHVPPELEYDLMLAGHTHGGQVRIPGLVNRVVPTNYPFDKELHTFSSIAGDRLVYVTSGTGMVGVPLRFNMPPRIDILTLHLPETR
ncbi:MAG: metallophosphoesterase [Pseudomonadota bacterium]